MHGGDGDGHGLGVGEGSGDDAWIPHEIVKQEAEDRIRVNGEPVNDQSHEFVVKKNDAEDR